MGKASTVEDEHGTERQLKGSLPLQHEHGSHGEPVDLRDTQVALQDVDQPAAILDIERLIEAQFFAQSLVFDGTRVLSKDHPGGDRLESA